MKNMLRYMMHVGTVWDKCKVLHRFSVLLDEATPEQLEKSLQAWRIFKREQGYLRSLVENQCVDANGSPVPWYTYPAIEQLSKWDFSNARVLEYGCGNSTLWWMRRAAHVTSIESSKEWYQRVKDRLRGNCEIHLSEVDESGESVDVGQIDSYVNLIDDLDRFDVIIVDGVNQAGVRYRCAEKALDHLNENGLLIVDNTDWLPRTCAMLREKGLLEVDYSGLGPLNIYAETTSFFMPKGFKPNPVHPDHPGFSIGGLKRHHDLS